MKLMMTEMNCGQPIEVTALDTAALAQLFNNEPSLLHVVLNRNDDSITTYSRIQADEDVPDRLILVCTTDRGTVIRIEEHNWDTEHHAIADLIESRNLDALSETTGSGDYRWTLEAE